MGLLNDVKATAKPVEAKAADAATTNDKRAKAKERKAAKKDALKRVLDYLKAHPVAELADDVKMLTVVERSGSTAFGPSKLSVLFGSDAPASGSKVTALECFNKAGLGYPEMKKYMKKWAEKGIVVELDAKTATYIVK